MIAILVDFRIPSAHVDAFREAVLAHAANSLSVEDGCLRFDVSQDPEDASSFFLHEIYADRGAFDRHAASEHLGRFVETTRPWIGSRNLRKFELLDSGRVGEPIGSNDFATPGPL